jgi:hypothetical protein
MEWQRWGAYPSKKEAQEALDHLHKLSKMKPASTNGLSFYDSYEGM